MSDTWTTPLAGTGAVRGMDGWGNDHGGCYYAGGAAAVFFLLFFLFAAHLPYTHTHTHTRDVRLKTRGDRLSAPLMSRERMNFEGVYSHHHHIYIVYRYTKHTGPIVYSHHHV